MLFGGKRRKNNCQNFSREICFKICPSGIGSIRAPEGGCKNNASTKLSQIHMNGMPFDFCLQNDKIYLLQNSCNNYKPSKQCFFNFVFSGVNCANHASHIHQNNSQNICRNAHSSHDVRVKNRIVTDGPFKGHKVKNNKILFLLTILQPRRTFYNVLGRDFRNKMYK